MTTEQNNERCKLFRAGLKFFSIGIVIGCLGGLFWQELFSPLQITPAIDRDVEINILKQESQERLLKYIEGKWRSSIGDLIIQISDSDPNGGVVVIENIPQIPKRQEKFKVVGIVSVDSFFGVVKLNLCSIERHCSPDQIIPIQINKIFEIENTIAISFDKRIAFCITEEEEICTRSFKLLDR